MGSREKVVKAMRTCARNMFLPEAHRNPDEAFVDSPVRLDALDFNVSAPHMHATCLVSSPCCHSDSDLLFVFEGCALDFSCSPLP